MKIRCILTPETLWIFAMVLLYHMLLLWSISTAQNTPAHRRGAVLAELNETAVLSSEFCDIHHTDIYSVEWKKYENLTLRKVLIYKMPNQTKHYLYQGRVEYHFDNQSLIFYKVQKKDEGVYEAILNYINGTILSQNITLSVNPPPEIHKNGNGSHWNLTCEYSAAGLMSRRWLQNGQPLSMNNRYAFSEGNQTLFLKNMTVEDCGTYSCEVTGGIFKKVADIHLTGANTPLCAESAASTATLITLAASSAIILLIAFAIMCLWKYFVGRHRKYQATDGKRSLPLRIILTSMSGSQEHFDFANRIETQLSEMVMETLVGAGTATAEPHRTQLTSETEPAYMVPDDTIGLHQLNHHIYEVIGGFKEETHSTCVYTPQRSRPPSLPSPGHEQQSEGTYSLISLPQPTTLSPLDIPGAVDLSISDMDQ